MDMKEKMLNEISRSSETDIIKDGIVYGHITTGKINYILRVKIKIRKRFPDINFLVMNLPWNQKYGVKHVKLYGDYYKYTGDGSVKCMEEHLFGGKRSGHGYRKI